MTRADSRAVLAAYAIDVAAAAPVRFGKHGHTCYIPRALVKAIRAELDRAGIDWRAMVKARIAADLEARAERAARSTRAQTQAEVDAHAEAEIDARIAEAADG